MGNISKCKPSVCSKYYSCLQREQSMPHYQREYNSIIELLITNDFNQTSTDQANVLSVN